MRVAVAVLLIAASFGWLWAFCRYGLDWVARWREYADTL